MKLYSIDTAAWICFLRGRPAKVATRVQSILENDKVEVGLDGIVLAELLQGVKTNSERKILEQHLTELPILPVNRSIFERAGRLNAILRRRGLTIPITDAIIAATALYYKATILTIDEHFAHFPKLRCQLIKY